MSEEFFERLRYFGRCLLSHLSNDISCPSCRSYQHILIMRKMGVARLFECKECGLRFRVPKDNQSLNRVFYQKRYKQGFTTDIPNNEELSLLLKQNFAGTQRDYSTYIQVIKAVGLPIGSSIFDFGCSWGYGSYQLKRAGYNVISYEISEPRARFASSKLGLTVVNDLLDLQSPVDCFFSSHVMEHLYDPNILWQTAASKLKPGGLFIAFFPNGDPKAVDSLGMEWYKKVAWNRMHPLAITLTFLKTIAQKYSFDIRIWSNPYDFNSIERFENGSDIYGEETLVIGRYKG